MQKTTNFETIPSVGELLYPIFSIYFDSQIHQTKDFVQPIISQFNSDSNLMQNPVFNGRNEIAWQSGKRLVLDRINWSKTFLYKAKLLDLETRGNYKISKRGLELMKNKITFKTEQDLLQMFPDLMQDKFWNSDLRTKKQKTVESLQEIGNPNEQLEIVADQLKNQIIDELTAQIKDITPRAFEFLVVKLLVAMGYGTEEFSQATSYTNDGEIDGIVWADELGFNKIYIQAKKYTSNIERVDLQNFVGAMPKSAKGGIFITTSDFGPNVKEYLSSRLENIQLISGEKLVELMYKHNQGVSTKQIIEIKSLDTDYFENLN